MSASNVDAFCGRLDLLKRPLDFTRNQLGRRLLDAEADRILERSAAERGIEGKWLDNQGKYGEEKRKKGLPVGVGLRKSDSPMLLPENVKGARSIEPESATMTYGTAPRPKKVAAYFSAVRPFFGMTDDDRRAIREEIAAEVRANLNPV